MVRGVALLAMAVAACSSGHVTTIIVEPDASVTTPDAGGDAGPTTPAGCIRGTGKTASQTIGHAGGRITLDTLVLAIQPDAIAADTLVTVTSSTSCPGDTSLASETPVYEITPAGLALATPADVSITYPGTSHGVMLFATTTAGDLGYLADSTDREEVHGSLAQLGAVWVASWPAVAPFNAQIVPSAIDPGAHATLLLGSDGDFSKDDCTVDNGIGALTWDFVFDATKQDYFPRAAIDVTTLGTYHVSCPTAGKTASATLAARPTPEVTFTASSPTAVQWSAPTLASCTLDGTAVGTSGTATVPSASIHALVCVDANGVRVSRWAHAPS